MSHSPTTGGVISGGACPRCKTPLIDPGGLGWCKSCGYCKSLENSKKEPPRVEKAPIPELESKPSAEPPGSTPRASTTWIWVTMIGSMFVAGATVALGTLLTLSPFERALLTTVQTGGAVVVILFGQFIGLLKVAPDDSTLNFWDAIFPFRLYGLIVKRVPATQLTVYLGAWGLAAIITANIFIGGLGHWLTYLPDSKKGPQPTQKTKSAR